MYIKVEVVSIEQGLDRRLTKKKSILFDQLFIVLPNLIDASSIEIVVRRLRRLFCGFEYIWNKGRNKLFLVQFFPLHIL